MAPACVSSSRRLVLLLMSLGLGSPAPVCDNEFRVVWSGTAPGLSYKVAKCVLPSVSQITSCLSDRWIHLVGDSTIRMPGQFLQSSFVGCQLGADGVTWLATAAGASADDTVFCQRLHGNSTGADEQGRGDHKSAWLSHPLGSMALTYEPLHYIHDIRGTQFWSRFVSGPAASPAAGASVHGGSSSSKKGARFPDAVILGAYWWHAVFPKLLQPSTGGSMAPTAKGPAAATAAAAAAAAAAAPSASDIIADYIAGVKSLLTDLTASPTYASAWRVGARGYDGDDDVWSACPSPPFVCLPHTAGYWSLPGRLYWRLTLPPETSPAHMKNELLLRRRVIVSAALIPLTD
jgi:hypothetical protein